MRISDWSSDVCSSDLRRAQLVAHGGQEVALGAVGHLGRFLGTQQLVLGFLALGYVAQRSRHAIDASGVVAHPEAARMHPAVAAVVAAHAVLVIVVLGIAAQVLATAIAHLVDVVGLKSGPPEIGRDPGLLALPPAHLP